MNTKQLYRFLKLEASGGIVLFAVAILALILANSSFSTWYQQLVSQSLFWVNEGLMAIFFLLVGLELKLGFLEGQLADLSQALLPAGAAIGGMLVPAGIYYLISHQHDYALAGWTIPLATDVAFAIGVLSLFSKRLPVSLKLFLLALAIFDDIGAITLIAILYTEQINYLALVQAGLLLVIMLGFNRCGIRSLFIYLLMGCWLWLCLLQSGIHPTIGGVLLSLIIPADVDQPGRSCLHRLEQYLHPWVAYLIMPAFALVNAGFPLTGLQWSDVGNVISLGIMLGLFIGKPVGVLLFSWLLLKLRLAKMPYGASWLEFYGVSMLCGIGFTMSLFLGILSFAGQHITAVRLGVLIGSLLSGLVGGMILLVAFIKRKSITYENG